MTTTPDAPATQTRPAKTWFITGTWRGFGREWTLAALERGDRVVATARNVDSLKEVVVNNAGHGQFGMIEELSDHEIREQVETSLFGALWVTQAALPLFRAQRSGHFLRVSSIGGISAFLLKSLET